GGDHGDDAGADGEPDRQPEADGQQRHEQHAAAQAHERAHGPRRDRGREQRQDEQLRSGHTLWLLDTVFRIKEGGSLADPTPIRCRVLLHVSLCDTYSALAARVPTTAPDWT